jgi:hypothetical protein
VVDRRRFKPAPTKPNHFQKATSVSLKIHDDTNSLTSSNLQFIHQAILDAANLWRFACTSCSINQLAIISVDGDVYLLDGINLPAFNPPNNNEIPQNRPFVPPPLQSISKGFNNRINARGHVQRYNYVSSILGDKRVAICEPDENRTRHFINFSDTPVCRPTREASENELKIDLVFIDGSTSCGDAVGCWNNNGLIQFDAKHYRYYLDHPSNTIIGRGAIPVDLMRVLTHEAGHWIGLDHVAGPSGIMSEYYEETRCIDDEAIGRLNAIVTGEQKAPLRPTGDTLKYRRPDL